MKEYTVSCPKCNSAWTVARDCEKVLCGCGVAFDPRESRVSAPIERALTTQRPSHVETEKPLTREVLNFLNDLCHPEQYGYAVTKEVRQRARELATKIETEDRVP